VGVGPAYTPPPQFTIVQEYRIEDCNTFTARAQNLNFGMTWHTTSNLLVDGNPGPYTTSGPSALIGHSGTPSGQVYATYTIGTCTYTSNTLTLCPCSNWNPNFSISWSNPTPGQPIIAQVDPHPDAIGYNWYIDNELVESMGQELFGYYDWPCGVHGVGVMAVFGCGVSSPVGDAFEGLCSSKLASGAKLYPNPASSSVTVELKNSGTISKSSIPKKTEELNGIQLIRIFDKLGVLRIQKSFTGKVDQAVIDLSTLPTDIYFVEIFDGKNKKRFPLIVKMK
jgi:hypothetical protein